MIDNSEAIPQVTDRGAKPCKLNYCCSRCFSNEMSSFFYWEHFGKGIAMTTRRRIGDFCCCCTALFWCPNTLRNTSKDPTRKIFSAKYQLCEAIFFSRNYHLNIFLSYYSFKLIGCAIFAHVIFRNQTLTRLDRTSYLNCTRESNAKLWSF